MKYENRQSIKLWAEDDRPREKLLNKGKATLSNAELLAILIGSGTAQESALDLARKIYEKASNNLSELGRLDIQSLMEVKGIGIARAITIIATMELGRRRNGVTSQQQKQIGTSIDVYRIMQQYLSDESHEQFWILLLNRANKVIRPVNISKGGVSGTVADPKIIFNAALRDMASGIILCHNHPSGNIKPSEADIRLTQKLAQAGNILDIPVLDHVIISRELYFSFADEGMM